MSVQELRARTGAGIVACNNALKEANGDVAQAAQILRAKGLDKAGGYTNRDATAGTIGVYLHHDGSIGAMVVLACETDFVARTPEFKQLANDLAMQIAASSPTCVTREDVAPAFVALETSAALYKVKAGSPDHVRDKVIAGHMEKFYQERCLVDQLLVTDNKTKIGDLIKLFSAKCGEKIEIKRFQRLGV